MKIPVLHKLHKVGIKAAALLLGIIISTIIGWRTPPVFAQASIFTTDCAFTAVNQNLYGDKRDVYLSGGPRQCAGSGGLAPGDYYFQVTDPNGGTLLSTDPLKCRVFTVSADGITTAYSPGAGCPAASNYACGTPDPANPIHNNQPIPSCGGRITIQLFPFLDTPNGGGIYKVWAMPVSSLPATCDPSLVDPGSCGGSAHGFVNGGGTKTDNFRVKGAPPQTGGDISVFKFCDVNGNGFLDPGELTFGLNGWAISSNPAGCSGTTSTINSQPGLLECQDIAANTYDLSETLQNGFQHTATCVNGECGHCSITQSDLCNANGDCPMDESCVPNGDVDGIVQLNNGDMDEVDFGNVGLGSIGGQKIDFSNSQGVNGLKILLTGTLADGQAINQCAITANNGTYSFGSLLPGTYTVAEMPPAGKTVPVGPTSCSKTVAVDNQCAGQTYTCNFTNICLGAANGHTLGYWANAGNSKITGAALCDLNKLNLRDGSGNLFQPGVGCPTPAPPTASQLTAVKNFLLNATATNMAYMLSAQAAAMQLNIDLNGQSAGARIYAGPSACIPNPPLSAQGIIALSDLLPVPVPVSPPLYTVAGDLGAHAYTPAGSSFRACQEYKKNALDKANNNLNFVVACPNLGQTCPLQ